MRLTPRGFLGAGAGEPPPKKRHAVAACLLCPRRELAPTASPSKPSVARPVAGALDPEALDGIGAEPCCPATRGATESAPPLAAGMNAGAVHAAPKSRAIGAARERLGAMTSR